MNKSSATGIDPNPEDRLKGGGEVTASGVLRNIKEARLWWSGRRKGNDNHRGSGWRVFMRQVKYDSGCLYVAQIRKSVGLDFQALKTRLVFNQGEPEKRITLQGCESESTLMTLAQPGCGLFFFARCRSLFSRPILSPPAPHTSLGLYFLCRCFYVLPAKF